METQNLYLSDFMTGLLAGLALKGMQTLSLRENRFDRAVEQLVRELDREAASFNLRVRFRIQTDRSHGDSSALQQALYEAARRDLISLDNPEFQDLRLKISPAEAPEYLASLPGSVQLYDRLAQRLLDYYRAAQ